MTDSQIGFDNQSAAMVVVFSHIGFDKRIICLWNTNSHPGFDDKIFCGSIIHQPIGFKRPAAVRTETVWR